MKFAKLHQTLMVYLNGFFCRDTLSNAENNGATSTGLLLVTLFIRLSVSSEPCYDLHRVQQVNNLFFTIINFQFGFMEYCTNPETNTLWSS